MAFPLILLVTLFLSSFSDGTSFRPTPFELTDRTVNGADVNDCDDIRFGGSDLRSSSGNFVELTQPTSITIWQDGKLYIGTQIGVVQVLDYDSCTLVTNSLCTSERLTDDRYKTTNGDLSERSILGITFDPRDKEGRPYVSVSTLHWERRDNIAASNKRAWSNGAVERLMPTSAATRARNPRQCLQHDRNIVRNLPVADGDHGVNELLFDQDGNLLISIGGYTNMGLPYAGIGGNWETYFSGAVVKSKLSKGAFFNGTIPYTTPENLRTARPMPGYSDVELFATGVRNLFSLSMARSGMLYGVDMGPNCRFGNASSSCDEYVEAEATQRSTSRFEGFPGQVFVGPPGECRFGDTRLDKILEIKAGKFYGHPNIQRAVLNNSPGECQWIDPETDRVPPPLNNNPPTNYESSLGLVQRPQTGIREYGGNWFCGKLRGDLILSQLSGRGVWRARLSEGNRLSDSPSMIGANGGIRVEENARGDLLFPNFRGDDRTGIFVMRPDVREKNSLFVANAVPFRHGRGGGTNLIVGGSGFEAGASVMVGENRCPVVRLSSTEISCTVPPMSSGSNSVSVTVSFGGASSDLPRAVLYMNV